MNTLITIDTKFDIKKVIDQLGYCIGDPFHTHDDNVVEEICYIMFSQFIIRQDSNAHRLYMESCHS